MTKVTDTLTLESIPLSSNGTGDITSIGTRTIGDETLWGYPRNVCDGSGAVLEDLHSGNVANLFDVTNATLSDYRVAADRCHDSKRRADE